MRAAELIKGFLLAMTLPSWKLIRGGFYAACDWAAIGPDKRVRRFQEESENC
jgi:hypothetical protein